jgi:hypothetical protein
MPNDKQNLDAEAIVNRAFNYFGMFVARDSQLDGVLLEGLEPLGDGWIVAIGFDGQRKETSEPANVGSLGALSGFGSKTTTTVREVRRFHIDNEGTLQKIE